MYDILDVIKNIESITEHTTSFEILKDFERVLDELDIYLYNNWEDGELAMGPKIERHWVTCGFMWDRKQMPEITGAKKLVDYDCKVKYKKTHIIVPRTIKDPGDIRPGTKKGKLDRKPVWIVEIRMPKRLITTIWQGNKKIIDDEVRELETKTASQDADRVTDENAIDDQQLGAGL